jgi:hypothetical protein
MAVQLLSRLFLLLAMLLMPLGMTPSVASAPHADGTSAMPGGHCSGQSSDHSAGGSSGECAMACAAALPGGEAELGDGPPLVRQRLNQALAEPLIGLRPETDTPPPKRS